MKAGVSTACLYPDLLEKTLEDLLLNGVDHVEIFVNTACELEKNYVQGLANMLKQYGASCRSLHPFTCAMEPMMFFSVYERRVDDILEFYRQFFEAMNLLGADIFVFHGNKLVLTVPEELYFERFIRLVNLGREYGITVTQENVSRCQSCSLSFQSNMKKAMGNDAKFVLDIKQAIRAGENPFQIINVLGDSIIHIHMSDNGKKGDCLPLGKGSFDIRKFLAELSAKGFDGSVMIELYRSNFSDIKELSENFHLLQSIIESIN